MNASLSAHTATRTIVAPSSRKALRLVREQLGPDAILLSSRVTPEGIEVVAAIEASAAAPADAVLPLNVPVSAPYLRADLPPAPQNITNALSSDAASYPREIHSMHGMPEQQPAGIKWSDAYKPDPVHGHLLRTLLGAGFSARLAKDALADLPTGQDYLAGLTFVKSTLARQLPILEDEDTLMEEGGVFALMGPTGVGKTTTTAKLAARYVMRFGPEKLALVTTDSYRIGAYEQLRIYGQILGVPVYAVKDAVNLERVLNDLRDKHMVLIDTVGRSQRDRAVPDQIAMLCGASRPVKRLLLLNAASHGDTLNEVVHAYRDTDQAGIGNDLVGCIFTKVDEATHPAVLIDTAIRHRLPVYYVSSGQQVPEHLALVDARALVDSVLQERSASAFFVPDEAGLNALADAVGNQANLAAADAVSERLRLQCGQLVRALTHDSRELGRTAGALSAGQIGFDAARDLWGQLSDDGVGQKAIEKTLHSLARTCSDVNSHDYILRVAGELQLNPGQGVESFSLFSHLALSDRNGLPLAAPFQWLSTPEPHSGEPQHGSENPFVELLARMPAPNLMQAWQSSGLQWAAAATGTQRVAPVSGGAPTTLAKLAAGLAFGAAQPAMFRKKSALVAVAEVLVLLQPAPQDDGAHPHAAPVVLRCIVKRVVDAATGKTLSHCYLLASTDIQATAEQMLQWGAWRVAAQRYFKLVSQSMALHQECVAVGDQALAKRLLIAGQLCTTVLHLQHAQDQWATRACQVLTQLAGQSGRGSGAALGLALFEGLEKLFVLLDALDTEGVAALPRPELAPVQG